MGECGPGLAELAGGDELPGGCLQRLRPLQRPSGVAVTVRGREQPGGVVIQQAAAVERVRLAVRDLGSSGVQVGAVRNGLCSAQVADPSGEANRISQQDLGLIEFFACHIYRVG